MSYTPKQLHFDILELQFKKDSAGRTAFFPMGSSKPGYIIPDDEKKNEIKKILAKYEMSLPPLIFFNYYANLSTLSILSTIILFIFATLNFISKINKATTGLEKISHSNDFFKNEPSKKIIHTTLAFVFLTFSWGLIPEFFKMFGFKAIIAFIFIHVLLIILTIIVFYNSINNKDKN